MNDDGQRHPDSDTRNDEAGDDQRVSAPRLPAAGGNSVNEAYADTHPVLPAINRFDKKRKSTSAEDEEPAQTPDTAGVDESPSGDGVAADSRERETERTSSSDGKQLGEAPAESTVSGGDVADAAATEHTRDGTSGEGSPGGSMASSESATRTGDVSETERSMTEEKASGHTGDEASTEALPDGDTPGTALDDEAPSDEAPQDDATSGAATSDASSSETSPRASDGGESLDGDDESRDVHEAPSAEDGESIDEDGESIEEDEGTEETASHAGTSSTSAEIAALDAGEQESLAKADTGDNPAVEKDAETDDDSASSAASFADDDALADTVVMTVDEEESAETPEHADPVDHTRELPVLRAEELWFIYDEPPSALSPGTEIEGDGHTFLVVAGLGVQTFERRYRVTMDGKAQSLLLKQGARGASFVRYGLEAEALGAVHEDDEPVAGIPRVYAHWCDDDHEYLVTDMPGGRPYAHVLSEGKIDLAEHVAILKDLTRIVHRFHSAGYIITSLRPTSFDVVPGHSHPVQIADLLNLCETVEPPPYPLASPFTAPEITEQSPADEGADIFSIGALLYRIVTGEDVQSTSRSGFYSPATPATRQPMVSQILARTLGAPSERFFDVSDLEKALEQLEHELAPQLRIDVALRSSTGINPMRIVNQDSGGYHEIRRMHRSVQRHVGFYCVADGMGGHEEGDRASELATSGALRCFQQLALEIDHDGWRDGCAALCKRIAAAGSAHLVDTIREEGGARRMGTTFTGVLVVDDCVALAHLGDSRAMLFRDDTLELLSEDHSLVGMMVKAGQMTEEQAEQADEKNILMRSLGADHPVRPELFDGLEAKRDAGVFKARPGDRIILVSDGVWGMVPRPDIARLCREHANASELCDVLCNEAIRRGGGDNVVVLTLDFQHEAPILGAASLNESLSGGGATSESEAHA